MNIQRKKIWNGHLGELGRECIKRETEMLERSTLRCIGHRFGDTTHCVLLSSRSSILQVWGTVWESGDVRSSRGFDFSIGGMWKKSGHFILLDATASFTDILQKVLSHDAQKSQEWRIWICCHLSWFYSDRIFPSWSSDIRFFEHRWFKQTDCWALISLLLEELFKVNKIHKAVTNYKVTETTIHFLTLSSRGNCGHT